jgi:hypothetical protein
VIKAQQDLDLETAYGVTESAPAFSRGPETLVLYRTRPIVSVQVDPGAGGARAIQLFEGSRSWVGNYANSMVLGLVERLREQIPELAKMKAGRVRL